MARPSRTFLRALVRLRNVVAWAIAFVLVVALKFGFPYVLFEYAPYPVLLLFVFIGAGLTIVRGLAWLGRKFPESR